MPDQPQTEPRLIDADTAYSTVQGEVYAPVFFEKVAQDYGLTYTSPEAQLEALTMASQLRQAYDARPPADSAGDGLLKQAHAQLNQTLGVQGTDPADASSLDASQIKVAAANAARDPNLAAAVLSLQTHAAQALVAQA